MKFNIIKAHILDHWIDDMCKMLLFQISKIQMVNVESTFASMSRKKHDVMGILNWIITTRNKYMTCVSRDWELWNTLRQILFCLMLFLFVMNLTSHSFLHHDLLIYLVQNILTQSMSNLHNGLMFLFFNYHRLTHSLTILFFPMKFCHNEMINPTMKW